ncbi:GntR family transcriptional regulator [Actinocorallia herbida]|uniref:GntR family transcriptional regulator n=1 Tax=Actinocorallia herbida TaxID=58109 RepID=A0A3N1CMK5_9ACTN|nr:GntR family transcriptional regulator [Actinocorallia herbida]
MVNPLSARPQYRQVADELRRQIKRGRLRRGEPLPSELQLEEEFGVGAGTIRRALPILVAEGLVVPAGRGLPYRVADRLEPEVIRVGPATRVASRIASEADSDRFRVAEGAFITVVERADGDVRCYAAGRVIIEFRIDGDDPVSAD